MLYLLIVLYMVLAYFLFATIYHDDAIVGIKGAEIGSGNIELFGLFAYIDTLLVGFIVAQLILFAPLRKRYEYYLSWIMAVVAILFFEAIFFAPQNQGVFAAALQEAIVPLLGEVGLWLVAIASWLMSFLLFRDHGQCVVWGYVADIIERSSLMPYIEPIAQWLSSAYGATRSWVMKYIINPFGIKEEDLSQEQPPQAAHEPHEYSSMPSDSYETQEPEAPYQEPVAPEPPKQPIAPEPPKYSYQKQSAPATIEPTAEPEPDYSYLPNKEPEPEPEPTPAPKPAQENRVQKSKNLVVDELEENSKILSSIEKGKVAKPKNFKLPKLDFLQKAPKSKAKINESDIDRKIEELLSKLAQFKINGDVVRTYTGPLVTTFEFRPAANVKVSKILNLQDDLAMALAAKTIRIQAPIPGRDVVGIEIPNSDIETIYLREILEDDLFKSSASNLTVALGKDIVGNPFITDIKKLPHLLIAGTTGSGKSVGINAMILSLLYRNDPDQLKLMLIDPKMLEFASYEDIPHLITPVITEPNQAIAALANMVGEMERRYKLMAKARTKTIESYNEKCAKSGEEPFPFIVVIIDELADLMMNGGKDVELSIARLAQKSRACGIHLIVATQRPSVDVVTGLIKANLPSRLSYRVGQRIDSKVILDQMGAESLLGRGDGLFTPPGSTALVRIHAPWNSEDEIEKIVEFIKAQREPNYDQSYLEIGGSGGAAGSANEDMELDTLFEEAKAIVLSDKKTSISYLQRKLQIGYNRSANIIEQLEQQGILSAPNSKGVREIL